MNTHSRVCFLVTFTIIAFGAMCLSQTFDRTSLPHYLCWISAFTAVGGAAFIIKGFKVEDDA